MPFFSMYWQRVARRPGTIIMWMAVPFVFMVIYQGAFGGSHNLPKTSLAVVDYDNTPVSRFFTGALAQGPVARFLNVREAEDSSAIEALFASDRASAALIVSPGFSSRLLAQEPDTLVLLTNPRHSIGPRIARGVVETFAVLGNGLLDVFSEPLARMHTFAERDSTPQMDDISGMARASYAAVRRAPGFGSLSKIHVQIVEEKSHHPVDGINLATLFFPGLIMFGIFSASLSLETRFLIDRLNGVTRRFVTAPVRPARVAVEQRLFAFTFLYCVAAIASLLGGIVWHIPTGGVVDAAWISAALILFVVGFNGAVYSLSNSRKAVAAIATILMMVLMISGGAFFPAEFTPEWFQHVSLLTPTGMANIALTHALTGRTASISAPALWAWALGTFIVGMALARRRIA